MDNCLTNHPQCKCRRDKGRRSSSRLIDVGDANSPFQPRIWFPRTASVPYITLSHRWGTCEQIKLTQASLPDTSKRIDVANLSQTYQEVIAIRRSLGFRYLWIDSLCIIQDSMTDWRTEAARMGDTFKFCVCTIAASWASSNSEGCFFNRRPHAKLSLSEAAKSVPRLPSSVRLNRSYRKRRNRLHSGTMPISDINSKEFECVLERRRSRLSTEVAGFSHDLLSRSLKHSSCTPASTMSLVIDPESVGDEDPGTSTPDTTSQSVFMIKIDDLENIPPCSNDRGALEILARIPINSILERNCSTSNPAIQEAHCKLNFTESAVLYIIPFQRDLWEHSVELSLLSRRAWVLQERLLPPELFTIQERSCFGSAERVRLVKISRIRTQRFKPILSVSPSISIANTNSSDSMPSHCIDIGLRSSKNIRTQC